MAALTLFGLAITLPSGLRERISQILSNSRPKPDPAVLKKVLMFIYGAPLFRYCCNPK